MTYEINTDDDLDNSRAWDPANNLPIGHELYSYVALTFGGRRTVWKAKEAPTISQAEVVT